MLNKIRAFTLVEMLVALAVSSIIIVATYASYDLVATQYKKNLDIADMHTSGRAIMQMIERDVRMAGFEYRDKDAKKVYGEINANTSLKLFDSGNKCERNDPKKVCDEVTVIYDYVSDEKNKKVERVRIHYWAEKYTGSKGARYRLYKQKDILGQNNKILANPILGDKDVMADYIDDFQIVNVENLSDLYIAPGNSKDILVMNAITKEVKPRIRTGVYIWYPSIAFGPDGLLYTSSTSSRYIQVIDPVTRVGGGVGRIPTEYLYFQSIAFGPNGLLYISNASRQHVIVIDPITKERKPNINTGRYIYYPSIAFGPDGLLYISSTSSRYIQVIDPVTKERKPNINTGRYMYYQSIAFGPDGLLYIANSSRRDIQVVNPITKEIMPNIDLGRNIYYPSIAFGPDGFLYISSTSRNEILAINPKTKKRQEFSIQRSGYYQSIAMKTKRTGQESLVTINLTLRTKNKYGKDRQFKKKDYHEGNYKLDKTDKYKRDTFSSTVLVRNLAL